MKRLAVALIALTMTVLPAIAAETAPDQVIPNPQAAAQCGPLDEVLGVLDARYGEHVLWWGRSADQVTMIITERPDTKTWTLLAVHDGLACMVGSGGTSGAFGA